MVMSRQNQVGAPAEIGSAIFWVMGKKNIYGFRIWLSHKLFHFSEVSFGEKACDSIPVEVPVHLPQRNCQPEQLCSSHLPENRFLFVSTLPDISGTHSDKGALWLSFWFRGFPWRKRWGNSSPVYKAVFWQFPG